MKPAFSRWTALALAVACLLGAGCQDKQRPKPTVDESAASTRAA